MMNAMCSCSYTLSKDNYTIDNIGSKCTIREENSPTTPKYPIHHLISSMKSLHFQSLLHQNDATTMKGTTIQVRHVQKAQEILGMKFKSISSTKFQQQWRFFWNPNPQHHKDFLLHMDGILATHVFEERILLSKFGGCNKKRIESFSGIH